MVFDKIKSALASTLASTLAGTPAGLDKAFEQLRKRNAGLADKLMGFVATGQDAAALMSLSPGDIATIDNDFVRPWASNLKALVGDSRRLSGEQWVRLGQIYALSPRPAYDPSRWPTVPTWFAALQIARQHDGDVVRAWDPAFATAVLRAGRVPEEQLPRAVLEGFFATIVNDQTWAGSWRPEWNRGKDTAPAQALVALVQANIALLPQALSQAPAPNKVAAAEWLRMNPQLLPPLAPMLAEWAVGSAKTVREEAVACIAMMPEPQRSQALSQALATGTPANLGTVVDQLGRMGEPGQLMLQANLGSGGKRDEMLKTALNRSQAVAQSPEVSFVIPPAPPLDTTPLGPQFSESLMAAVARWATNLESQVAANPTQKWPKDNLSFARSFSPTDAEAVRSWLNGQAKRPKVENKLPTSIIEGLKLPLLAAVRYAVTGVGGGQARLNPWQVNHLIGPDYDLRCLEAAARLAGVADPLEQVSDVIFYYNGLEGRDPELVWPFFAEHPEGIDVALGVPPAKPNPGHGRLSVALTILAMFPALPTRYLPFLAEVATGETKAFRRQAQELLEGQPNALDIAVQTLTSSKQEVRAVGAAWIGRIGDPAGIVPLRTALDKEKREQPQAAMLNALRLLGDDISAHLTAEKLGAAAEKGLAATPPASMAWFPLDALPSCCWADGTPVAPEIIRWWAVLAVKLKDPLGAGLIPLYVSLLDSPSRQALGSYALESWIARDTLGPSDEEARAYATANVDSRYSNYQSWAKRSPEYYGAKGAMTRDQVFEELRREKAGEYLGSAIGEKGLLALSTGAPGHQVFAACQRYIRDHARRRAQVEALVTAAAGNPDPAAIQLVLSVARKFKQETVRLKAMELAEEIADRNGWTMDELADRTIPTAGFDESGLLSLDFGARTFTGRVARSPKTGAFTIDLFNADGKGISALPKPGLADDEALASESRKQLTTSKKELTQVAKLQAARLFEAMCLGRQWLAPDWREYLLAHPVMRHLISTLVWQAETPQGSYILFRPTVDGELLTSDDDTFDIPDGAKVRLAHRATVTEEEAAQWRTHLNDYKVTPLFNQFEAVAPPIAEGADSIDDHLGWLSDSFAIRGRATKRGYNRGAAEDGGWFSEYYKDLPGASLRVIIEFTGSILPEEQIPAAVTALVFAKSGRRIPLTEVPPILLAESYADYVHIAEAGTYDKDWQAKSVY